ncbi:MAG: Ig-like domain-containing protein [Hyphomicrobium sp.]
MAILRLERVPIERFNLGWFGGDHLHLVLQQDELFTTQDAWWVMEGTLGSDGTILRLGVDGASGTLTLSEANDDLTGAALTAKIGTPEWRGSHVIPLGGLEFEQWFLMAQRGEDIDAQSFPYLALADRWSARSPINSSSVIATLLYSIGIDITQYFPTTMRLSPGWQTLIGTSDDDTLSITGSFSYIYGGEGDDILQDSPGNFFPEKLYGGTGDDVFVARSGYNYYNGGELGLPYNQDGTDTVAYINIEFIYIVVNDERREHLNPDFYAVKSDGVDHYYSIERIEYDSGNTRVIVGPGVELLRDSLRMNLGDQSSNDRGDEADFSDSSSGLLINVDADGHTIVQASGAAGTSIGLWFESVEWLVGSAMDDRIYAPADVRGVEGGGGNDLIDVRLSTAFSGASPRQYDVEINGGAGDDTIVSGPGRTTVVGGAGADRFVLSSTTPFVGSAVEFVIEDAEAEDRLLVPHDLFNLTYADFDGSPLLPLLGAMGRFAGEDSFAELPQNVGSFITNSQNRSDVLSFEWQLQDDRHYGDDQTQGVIEFTGAILYNRDGNDLLIHLFVGDPQEVTELGNDESDWTHTINVFYPESETIIRVVNFQEGDLGIRFHDRGEPDIIDVQTDHGLYSAFDYPNWDEAVRQMTNGGVFLAPLDLRPDAPVYQPDEIAPQDAETTVLIGSADDDVLIATDDATRLEGGAGDDDLSGGDGNDTLDGGAGTDTMTGGAGDDTYIVDRSTDAVVESADGGRDFVISIVSHALADNVENLELRGDAETGTGTDAANQLTGNDSANVLDGRDGNDLLTGGLGDDTLIGGRGRDTYVHSLGDGDDTIRDFGDAADADTLILDGVTTADIALVKYESAPGDLFVLLADGSQIRIEEFDARDGGGIDRIRFADGTLWSRTEIEARADAAPVLEERPPFARADFGFWAASGRVEIPSADLLANDSSGDGGALSIVGVVAVGSGAEVTLLANGNLLLLTAEGFEGDVTFTYTIADAGGATSSAQVDVAIIPNYSPVADGALSPETLTAGTPWSFTLDADHFTDPDGDSIELSVRLANGEMLPGWLSFDSTTRTLSGTPPPGYGGELNIAFVANDGLSETEAVKTLTIDVTTPSPGLTILGTAGNDTLDGTAGSDTIIGQAGDDVLTGGAGNDAFLIDRNDGLDHFDGGIGFDTIRGGSNNDLIGLRSGSASLAGIEAIDGGDGFDVLRLSTGDDVLDLTGIAVTDIEEIRGRIGVDSIFGSAGNDTIVGGGGGDRLFGGDGDDTFLVVGGSGFDEIDGGAGYDVLRGSAGDDRFRFATTEGNLSGLEAIEGGGGIDEIRLSNGNDVLDLSGLTVVGISRISSGAGSDRIVASHSSDLIFGGGQADEFVFRRGTGHDTIADFQRGTGANPLIDVIDLTDFSFADFAELMAHATQDGADTLITLDADSSLRLLGVNAGNLLADDFRLG